MEHQHQLNQDENNSLAAINALSVALGALHEKIEADCMNRYQALGGFDASTSEELDIAYAACEASNEAKRNLQTGLMWLQRAVLKPSGF